jgi:hypothetical protein
VVSVLMLLPQMIAAFIIKRKNVHWCTFFLLIKRLNI